MTADLGRAMRAEATRVLGEMANTRMAIVDGYDPENYAVRVKFQPEGGLSGWLPLLTLRAGDGAGIYAPPNVGDQVVVGFQEADRDSGVVLGALYSDTDKPLAVPAGEVWIVLENGARLKLLANGGVDLFGALVRAGGLDEVVRRLVDERFQALFNGHTHPGNGQPPTQKITDDHMTTTLRGG